MPSRYTQSTIQILDITEAVIKSCTKPAARDWDALDSGAFNDHDELGQSPRSQSAGDERPGKGLIDVTTACELQGNDCEIDLSDCIDSAVADENDNISLALLSAHPLNLGFGLSRIPSPIQEPEFLLSSEQTADLLRSYLSEIAIWCETTDSLKHFSILRAQEMLENKIFKAAALAVSSRQLHLNGHLNGDIALRCYQYTIRLFIQQDLNQIDPFVLAACILLGVYEMMASEAKEWRRHLQVRQVD